MVNNQIIAKNKILELIEEAKKININIEEAYLFGSYAKNEQKEFSDIDVALVSKDFTGNSFLDSVALDKIILKIGREIETHTYKPDDFIPMNLFVKEILETGIKLV
jgi:predicted nucleotidyltransferase